MGNRPHDHLPQTYPSEERIRAPAKNCTTFLLAALEPKWPSPYPSPDPG